MAAPAESERNKDVVARFLPALVADDAEAMRPLVHDDVVWWVPASSAAKFGLERPLRGWDTIDWFGGHGWKAFVPGSSTLIVHHVVAEGDLVSAHYRRTATLVSGGGYDTEYNILFRLADGRIAEVWEVADTAAAFSTRR
jgi:ketosteroid isomerase-like protein